ncbi:DUF7940 domain-containing protein [Kaistia sp. MMO-174]|uniref:DUF7940 domain-containing protein n=1 Tax=Kaistia sp. MMO-174 TaxID=3081256 RepID=UPI003FA56CA3
MFIENWRQVLRRAWSIRLLIIAGALSGLEVALPLIGVDTIPAGTFAALSGLVTAAAFVARLIAQKGITDE